MDDFRVGSTSPIDAYRDREQSDAKNRKGKRHKAEAPEDVYVASGQAEDAAESGDDTYSPSKGTEETE